MSDWPENVCPKCNEFPEIVAKNFQRTSYCPNNHTWHTCCKCKVIVEGDVPKIGSDIGCTCGFDLKENECSVYNFSTGSLDEIFQVIYSSSRQERKTILEMLGKLTEETGEVAQEILIKQRSPGMTHKEPGEDGILGECVDTMIVAACIAFKDEATIEEVRNKFIEKLEKWRKVSINV